ncbi:hypothetical protein RhiJN_05121 [Ceratobasidium sp. AG-Ba]|nr:hypothetical protein RhiJN_05121 [Ceratobasidium sp. AG-Ba]QRW06047.1 hypothetical protein RhiLY_05046 [Ceratobasidium sp. AG-Ba]
MVAQRNFRAVRELTQHLGFPSLALFMIPATIDKSSLVEGILQLPLLRRMEDFQLWSQSLAFQDVRQPDQLLESLLSLKSSSIYAQPVISVTKISLHEMFRRIDVGYAADLRASRLQSVKQIDQARQECQTAESQARSSEQALQHLTVQHNTLLQSLNLRDNTELSELVYQFRSLNKDIDGFSLQIARAMPAEHYARFPNTSKCHDLDSLTRLLGVSSDSSLVIKSRDGRSMPTRQLLELLVASAVCFCLKTMVFGPFYPVDPGNHSGNDQVEILEKIYADIKLNNSQMVAAKWRIETYRSLAKINPINDERRARILLSIADLINDGVQHLVGIKFRDLLTQQSRLVKLVTCALELNDTIKAEVAHAGDIFVEYHHHNEAYDDSRMTVLDSSPGDPLPTHIVSACGLGVGVAKAVGGGKEPEATNLLKAVVASEAIYD